MRKRAATVLDGHPNIARVLRIEKCDKYAIDLMVEFAKSENVRLETLLSNTAGLLKEAKMAINGLVDQQAMPDDFWKVTVEKIDAALDRINQQQEEGK